MLVDGPTARPLSPALAGCTETVCSFDGLSASHAWLPCSATSGYQVHEGAMLDAQNVQVESLVSGTAHAFAATD